MTSVTLRARLTKLPELTVPEWLYTLTEWILYDQPLLFFCVTTGILTLFLANLVGPMRS